MLLCGYDGRGRRMSELAVDPGYRIKKPKAIKPAHIIIARLFLGAFRDLTNKDYHIRRSAI